jgi:cobalt-zinc-cadmium efflux system outer membrane protein
MGNSGRLFRLFPLHALLIVAALATDAPAQTPSRTQPSSEAHTTLHDVEQLALQSNPTLVQARANLEASLGRALQAGLHPNPTVGYLGEQIGSDDSAGQQGFFVDQLIMTGGKLRLNRAKFNEEATQMQWYAVAQEYRVLNGVRLRYYQVLALQRLLQTYAELHSQADQSHELIARMVRDGSEQLDETDQLEAKLEAWQLKSQLEDTGTRYRAAWKDLASMVGEPEMMLCMLEDQLDRDAPELEWKSVLCHLLEQSPEVHIARADVRRMQFGLRRERVEPVPNIQLRTGAQYDFATHDPQALAEVGLQLPLFDKNQGNIRTAQAALVRSDAEVRRVELSLNKRLALAMESFQTSQSNVKDYREELLPAARKSYWQRVESLRKEEQNAEWSKVRDAHRNLIQFSIEYIDAAARLRRAEVAIAGLLLVDGLSEPSAPPDENRPQRTDQEDQLRENLQEPVSGNQGRDLERRLSNRPGG